MSRLCFLDTETTGLDARIHQPWELSWWLEDDPGPVTRFLPHTLDHADPMALKIGGYWERATGPWQDPTGEIVGDVARALHGVTLVAANPPFDAAMLTGFIGTPVWHYRMIDVSTVAMTVFGWARPESLKDTAAACRDVGYDIPVPDHTAEADVRTVRAVYYALRDIRASLRPTDVPLAAAP